MSDAQAPVLAEVRNRIGHLTLNRPDGLNVLTLPMVRLLAERFEAWKNDPNVLAVVIRANGEKAFCAGGDVRAIYNSVKAGETEHEVFFAEEYVLDQVIHAYPKPVVALMDGLVLGGGMGLVQGATLRVITERTKMGMPETAIGYFPDVGGSYFLSRLPGELGTYLGVTGLQVRAQDALYARLADYCLPASMLEEFDRCLDNMQWTNHPREALRSLIATLAVNKLPAPELQSLQAVIDQVFALPDLPFMRTALRNESREPYKAWAQATLEIFEQRSPMAMSVTLEMLRRGRPLKIAECFAMELHLGDQWFDKGDIMEGVRALIIDKDRQPRWNPATLDEIDPNWVDGFFSPQATHKNAARIAKA